MNKRLFISHASEDKDSFVRQLASALQDSGIDVWYDEYEIKPGMSIRESVDRGLASCDVGILVFSKWYLNNSATLIPIYFDISHEEIFRISPSLSDIMGIRFANDIKNVAKKVSEKSI